MAGPDCSGALLVVATITPWLLLQASLPKEVLRYKFLGYWGQNEWLNVGLAVAAVVHLRGLAQLAQMSNFPPGHSAMSPLLSIPIMLGPGSAGIADDSKVTAKHRPSRDAGGVESA
jgi:hypothetical protein